MRLSNSDAIQSDAEDVTFLYQMAYCSILTQEQDEAAIKAMVAQAQRNNLAHNITGMLMIEQGLVIQWIEGKKADVRALWAKLQEDPRHHCIVELIHRNFVKERLFPDWSMQRTTREEMLAIIHSARDLANGDKPSPWAGALAVMCILIDPQYAQNYGKAMVSGMSANRNMAHREQGRAA
jgi:Sensors of blue-light using FAD